MRRSVILALLVGLLLSGAAAFAEGDPGGTVTIPLSRFLELTRQARPPAGGAKAQAPVSHAFVQGDYRVSVQGTWARVEADLALRVLHGGWLEIPLMPEEPVVAEAALDGAALSLYPKDGLYHFMVKGAGSHRLRLVYHLPVADQGPSRTVGLVTPDTPVSTLTLVVPGGKVQVAASPDLPLETRFDGTRTLAVGALPPGTDREIALSWTPQRADPGLHGQAAREEPRVYGRVYQLVTVSEKAILVRARVDCSILRNEVGGFTLSANRGAEVLDLACPNLEGWRVEDRSEDRLVHVSLSRPLTGDQALTLTTETPLQEASSTWTMPFVYLEGAERVKGSVGVCSSSGLELVQPEDPQGARRVDVQEDLPAPVHELASSPILLAYEYHRQPYQVKLESKKGEEVAVLDAAIDSASGHTLLTDEGKAVSVFTWQVRNNSRQSLLLALPEGAEVWSAFVDGRPAKPIAESDGRIRLPLVVSQGVGEEMGTFPVSLTWAMSGGGDGWLERSTLLAPRVDIPVSELTWDVYVPTDRRVLHLGGTMEPRGGQPRLLGVEFRGFGLRGGASAPAASVESAREDKAMSPAPGEPMQMVQAKTAGVFPVQVYVPEVGQVLRFTRLMVAGDETPSIAITHASRSLAGALGWIVFGLIVVVGARRLLAWDGWKLLALGWAALFVVALFLGGSWLSAALLGLARALTILSLLWGLLWVGEVFKRTWRALGNLARSLQRRPAEPMQAPDLAQDLPEPEGDPGRPEADSAEAAPKADSAETDSPEAGEPSKAPDPTEPLPPAD